MRRGQGLRRMACHGVLMQPAVPCRPAFAVFPADKGGASCLLLALGCLWLHWEGCGRSAARTPRPPCLWMAAGQGAPGDGVRCLLPSESPAGIVRHRWFARRYLFQSFAFQAPECCIPCRFSRPSSLRTRPPSLRRCRLMQGSPQTLAPECRHLENAWFPCRRQCRHDRSVRLHGGYRRRSIAQRF